MKKNNKEIIIDLPDVEDIPGQENIKPPKIREMIDTTISSADEEGDNIFKNDDSIYAKVFGSQSSILIKLA